MKSQTSLELKNRARALVSQLESATQDAEHPVEKMILADLTSDAARLETLILRVCIAGTKEGK